MKVKSCDGLPEKVVACDFEVYVEIRKKLPVSPGSTGFTSEPTGRYAMRRVRITVDLMGIARKIGGRAMLSKSGKSKYMEGCVTAKRMIDKAPSVMEGE